MGSNEVKSQINEILSIVVQEIEITPSKYEDAENRYTSVGEWLDREDSSIKLFSPEIYVQGSFRLGTVIKPISDDGEFDIDSVCVLNLSNEEISQAFLKECVGKEIRLYAQKNNFNKPIKEGKRCWTLNYADNSRFHMDILPAIPFEEGFSKKLLENSLSSEYVKDTIAITDNTTDTFRDITPIWPISNPKGYTEWFRTRMSITFYKHFSESSELQSIYASVESVPANRIKTPLQSAIQILKRHRDIMFGDKEEKPISIIITTLSAHAYENETNILDAIMNISQKMLGFIKIKDGEYWIENPVNPLENFADKWKDYPERKTAFYNWNKVLIEQLSSLSATKNGLNEFGTKIAEMMGESLGMAVIKNYGLQLKVKRENANLAYDKNTIMIGNSGSKVKEHTFYGKTI